MLMKKRLISLFLIASPGIWVEAKSLDFTTAPPDLNTGNIINESYNFLKEREPEMTDNEYALYEQVLPMVFDEPEFALTLLETLVSDDEPESPAFAYALGNVYFSSEHYDLAEKYYRDALHRFPEFVRCWTNLGTLYYTLEKYEEAIPCLVEAINLGNREAYILGLLGYSLKETGNPLAAESAFQQAYTSDPANSDWAEALYSLYMDAGDYQRATLLARQLIRLNNHKLQFWMYLVGAQLARGEKEEAMVSLETAFQMGVSGLTETLLLGDLYAEQKLYNEAVRIYRKVLKMDPDTGFQRLMYYVKALISEGNLDEAENVLTQFENEAPEGKQVDWYKTRMRLAMEKEQWEAVVRIAQKAINLEPLDGECLFSMGKAYRELERPEKAEFFFEQATQTKDFRFLACVELANLAVRQARYRTALRKIDEALEIENRPELESYLIRVRALLNEEKEKSAGKETEA